MYLFPTEVSHAPVSRWFVVETLPRKEWVAAQNLERQGYSCFLPRLRKVRRHARRVEQVLAPVFPGYAFVSFDPEKDPWRAINGTIGVRRLIAARSSRPQPMPDDAMAVIQGRCEGGILRQDMVPGDRVRFVSGPFSERLATIDRLEEGGRIRVLLDILGSTVDLAVTPGHIAPV